MTQPESISMVLRISLSPRGDEVVLFSLDLLLERKCLRTEKDQLRKLFGCPDLPFKLSSYMSPLISFFG